MEITLTQLRRVAIVLPPVKEQEQIAKHLEKQVSILESLTSRAEAAMELLQERRTALISAAVTGKINVRGWKPPSSAAKSETEMEVA